MIKGGGSIHAQNVADVYVSNNNASGAGVVMGAKSIKKNMNNDRDRSRARLSRDIHLFVLIVLNETRDTSLELLT